MGSIAKHSGRYEREDGTYVNIADLMIDGATSFNQGVSVEPTQQFVYKSIFPISDQRDVTVETGDGDVTQQNGSEYRVRATSGVAQLQTKQYGDYIPYFTMVPGLAMRTVGTPTGDARILWGYFEYDGGVTDGNLIIYDADGFHHKVYKNSTEQYSQTINLHDPTSGYIYHFPFVYYAYGWAGFDFADRDSQGVYRMQRRSTYYPDGKTMMNTSNLPLTVRVEGDGSQLDAFVGGRHMTILGSIERAFRTVSAIRKNLGSIGSTDYLPLVSVQARSNFPGTFIQLGNVSTIADTDMELAIFRDASLTGASFDTPGDYDSTETATVWDTSATAMSGGDQVFGDIVQGGTGARVTFTSVELPDKPIVDGDTWTIALRTLSGTGTATLNATVRENW